MENINKKKYFILSGFNNSNSTENFGQNIRNYINNKYDISLYKYDYYKDYKNSSQKLIINTANELINYAYKENEVNICAWSLGCAILVECLNLIDIINSQLNQSDRININNVVLFSPAFYILDFKNFVKNLIGKLDYSNESAKKISKATSIAGIKYVLNNLKSLYHVFNISQMSKSGLEILSKYNTICFIPKNDAYVNYNKINKSLSNYNIPIITPYNNDGHTFILNENVLDEVVYKMRKLDNSKKI